MSHKKKLKLSPAMKLGMMIILLEGKHLKFHPRLPRSWHSWRFISLNPITPRELLDGRKIPESFGRATARALLRRSLIKKTMKYDRTPLGFTEQGLHKIKQWPEYGEIIAMKVAHDL